MLISNFNETSANPVRERFVKPSTPVPSVEGSGRQHEPKTGLLAKQAKTENRSEDHGEPARTSTQGSPQHGSRARLYYDSELSRVFVEILDPRTGNVVKRFPPQGTVEHLNGLLSERDSEAVARSVGRNLDVNDLTGRTPSGPDDDTAGKILDRLA